MACTCQGARDDNYAMLSMDNTSSATGEGGFERWHEVTCRNYSLSECRLASRQAFRARIASRPFGPLSLSDASAPQVEAIHMTRGPAEICKDPRDHFMLYLVADGRIDVAQDGRQARAQSGDLFLYDQTMPFSLDFHRNDALIVTVPRPLLVSRLPDLRRFMARRIAGTSKMGALAGSLVRQIGDLDAATKPGLADRLAMSTLDILATAMESELGDDAALQKERHRLLPQVERYLLARLHETDLDLESIARAQNIAPRTLNRVFAAKGTTPMRWLWQQRLLASHRALSEGRVDSVTDAALGAGFSDLSHFSRAFKREFGCLPHTVLGMTHSTAGSSGSNG